MPLPDFNPETLRLARDAMLTRRDQIDEKIVHCRQDIELFSQKVIDRRKEMLALEDQAKTWNRGLLDLTP